MMTITLILKILIVGTNENWIRFKKYVEDKRPNFLTRVYSMQAMEKVASRSRSLSYPKVTPLGQSGL